MGRTKEKDKGRIGQRAYKPRYQVTRSAVEQQVKCLDCGKVGHVKRNCPANRVTGSRSTGSSNIRQEHFLATSTWVSDGVGFRPQNGGGGFSTYDYDATTYLER
eukprot:11026199-Lingulodinium_polyedra.AAC.1